MDIKRAKKEIKDSIEAYLKKDAYGDYMIPAIRQRPILLMGPPGIGKTQIMEQIAKECQIGLVAYTITHHTRQSAIGLPFIREKTFGGKQYSVTEYTMSEIIASVYEKIEATGIAEGILFIDEAYSLYRGSNDSFGLECIDTLVKAMEDNREDLIVILAGYTREMQEFLQSNSGLQSRFPNQIEFPDYTGEELYKIALINAKKAGYKVDEAVEKPLTKYFTEVQKNDSVRSGNGRLSRNVI